MACRMFLSGEDEWQERVAHGDGPAVAHAGEHSADKHPLGMGRIRCVGCVTGVGLVGVLNVSNTEMFIVSDVLRPHRGYVGKCIRSVMVGNYM